MVRETTSDLMCFPICLNMIIEMRGYSPLSATEVAIDLGLTVPDYLAHEYPGAQVSENMVEWGVRPGRDVAVFLRKHGIPLICEYVRGVEIPRSSIMDLVVDNLACGNNIIVGYDYSSVFSGEKNGIGHASIIGSADPFSGRLELLDPEKDEPVLVDINRLSRGVTDRKDGGFWILAEQNGSVLSNYSV